MKNVVKFIGMVMLASVVFAACSKNDDPSDNDLFVGTYHGKVTYNTSSESKSNDNGKVTVVKVGANYNFVFSDGIPDLNGVQFRKDGDNSVISIDNDASKIIRINASQLSISYAKDGKLWTANCTR